MRLARQDPEELGRRVARLTVREQAELALRLPARRRLDFLLHAPQPMRLVRALPDAELYLTVREVGPTDALPLLALASASQTRHLLDLESWRRDRFDDERAGAWAALLVEAGEQTVRRFLRQADDEEIALLLSRWARLEQIETIEDADKHGHGEGDAGTDRGWLSPDGYHRFSPALAEHAPAVRALLDIMFREQPERYQRLVWASRWEMPSELEEQALHWRESRLEEHGFPRLEEALEIYGPPLRSASRPVMPAGDDDALVAPRAALRLGPRHAGLAPAIDLLDDATRERTLHELIGVANCLLVADLADPGDPDAHAEALEKAAGFVEVAARREGAASPEAFADLLRREPVAELFRLGWARAVELQARARRLVREGWATRFAEPLELLDSPIRERVLALLDKRPRFHEAADPVSAKPGYAREFRAPGELDEAAVALEMAELFGRAIVEVFGAERVEAARCAAAEPRFSTFLLTAMAWNVAAARLDCAPLPEETVATFLRSVASRRTSAPDAPKRAFEGLVARLEAAAGLDSRETALLHGFGRYCLEQLAEECGALDPGVPPDPGGVACLLLERRAQ